MTRNTSLLIILILLGITGCQDDNTAKSHQKAEQIEAPATFIDQAQAVNGFDAAISLIGKHKKKVTEIYGAPAFSSNNGQDTMPDWLIFEYDDDDKLVQIIFTFNTEAGSFAGEMPSEFSPSLTIEEAENIHGEADEVKANEYFYILDYMKSKGFKMVFDNSSKKIYRIHFIDAWC